MNTWIYLPRRMQIGTKNIPISAMILGQFNVNYNISQDEIECTIHDYINYFALSVEKFDYQIKDGVLYITFDIKWNTLCDLISYGYNIRPVERGLKPEKQNVIDELFNHGFTKPKFI